MEGKREKIEEEKIGKNIFKIFSCFVYSRSGWWVMVKIIDVVLVTIYPNATHPLYNPQQALSNQALLNFGLQMIIKFVDPI